MSQRRSRVLLVPIAAAAVALALSACSEKSDTTVKVEGTDDACTPSTDTVDPGTVTFSFHNTADDVSELYVLRADGSVASEVENVTTGLTRDLTVDLQPGTYTLTCKPGQAGDGFSATITVTGEVDESSDEGAAAPVIEVVADDYSFTFDSEPQLAAGSTYTFAMRNDGTMQHEMEVFAPDGTVIGEVGPTAVGKSGQVTLTLDESGTYRLVCGIDDHEAKGMVRDLPVS